jgi:hypothetical protein
MPTIEGEKIKRNVQAISENKFVQRQSIYKMSLTVHTSLLHLAPTATRAASNW